MKNVIFKKVISYFLFAQVIFFASCKKEIDSNLLVGGKVSTLSVATSSLANYSNGFYIVNEGWYGHNTGTVKFYHYDTNVLEDSVYFKANPGKNLLPTSSTVEFGTIFNGKFYLVSKVGGPLVVTDAYSMVESGRIASQSGNDWRAFVGVSPTLGLVSSGTGIFPLNLTNLTLGTKLTTVSGQIGDMVKAGNYIFVLSSTQGLIIFNANTYAVVQTIPGMLVGFTKTPDGAIWAAGGTSIIRIDPSTLAVQTITVPFTVYGSWAAWHPGSITASTIENSIFLAKNGTWSGGTTVYKYIYGNSSSLSAPFLTLPTGKELYGSAIGYNPANNELIITAVKSGFGTNYSVNDLYFYDASSATLKNDVSYSGYYFPANLVFH